MEFNQAENLHLFFAIFSTFYSNYYKINDIHSTFIPFCMKYSLNSVVLINKQYFLYIKVFYG